MEEQRASLAHVLMKDPSINLEEAVDELRRRLDQAIGPLGDQAAVEVVLRGDLVAIHPEVASDDRQLREALLAAIYRVKAEWIRDLNAEVSR